MHRILPILFIFALILPRASSAAEDVPGPTPTPVGTIRFALTFIPTGDPGHEYVVEKPSGAAGSAGEVWVVVAVTAASPYEFTDAAPAGSTYTIRMRTRLKADPTQVSEPSPPFSVTIPPLLRPPTGINLRVVLQVLAVP